ncbi:uncharacterized protein [Apostichopus japonicus]|uniref:uncharacterized protein n=1 Tax=Stichopus japonicus TaxID=307972 RepID=UPI003AB1FDFA
MLTNSQTAMKMELSRIFRLSFYCFLVSLLSCLTIFCSGVLITYCKCNGTSIACNNLHLTNISNNSLDENCRDIISGKSILTLILSHNEFSSFLDLNLATTVSTVDISFNNIINLALPHPSKELCGGLESLNFSFNQITSITEDSFRGMVKLATLDLSNNYISVLSSKPLSSLLKLEYLNLSFNIISRLSLQVPQLLKEINLNANCLNTITIETNFLKFIDLSCNLFTSVPILNCTHKSNVFIRGNQFDCSDEFLIRNQNRKTCNYTCIPEIQCKMSCNENKTIISNGKWKTTSSENSRNDQGYSTHINDNWMSTLVLYATTTTTATSRSFEIGGNNTSTILGTSFWCVVAVSGATFILLFLTLYKWYLTKKEFLRYSRQDEVYGLPAMSHRCPRTSPELIAMQSFQDAHESQPSVTGLGELAFNEINLGRVNTRIMATTVNENDIMKHSVGASRVVVLRPKRSLTRTRTVWSWI